MARSFGLVDCKIAEAEYFLRRLPECGLDFFAVQCNVSAYISAARSVTFALQSCLNDIDGFSDWYSTHQDALKNNQIAKFFLNFRNANQHIGDNCVSGGSSGPGRKIKYFFAPTADISVVPEEDVESACRKHFLAVLSIVYDCYVVFGPIIDPKQHYTNSHFSSLGKTLEDAEEEVFFEQTLTRAKAWSKLSAENSPSLDLDKLRDNIRKWTSVSSYNDEFRWQILRDAQPSCGLNHIFLEYLGTEVPEPQRVPAPEQDVQEGLQGAMSTGWVYIPEEFRRSGDPEVDIQLYIDSLRINEDT